MIQDVTERVLRDTSALRCYPSMLALAQAASKPPKTIGKAHEAALAVFRRESCHTAAGAMWILGPWGYPIAFGPKFVFGPKFMSESQHKALIQLVAAGRLRVLWVSKEDAKLLLPPGTPSSTVPPGASAWYARRRAGRLVRRERWRRERRRKGRWRCGGHHAQRAEFWWFAEAHTIDQLLV